MISHNSYFYTCQTVIQNSDGSSNEKIVSQCIEYFELYDTTISISFVNVLKGI